MKNKLIVFTGPSGVGKATIEKELFDDKTLNLALSISATTRAPREGEVNGVHYYFLTSDSFDKGILNNEFIEWNKHFSNKYGTLKAEIERLKSEGLSPLLEIETNGAMNIINSTPRSELISIFISPPSIQELRNRIEERGTETFDQINERMNRAKEEMSHKDKFQYVIVNDDIDTVVQKIKTILKENE